MALVRETIVHVMSIGRFLDVRVEAAPSGDGVAVTVDVVPLRDVRRLVFRGTLGLPEAALRAAAVDRFGPSPAVGRAADIARTVEDTLRGAGFLRAAVTPQPLATDRRRRPGVRRRRGRPGRRFAPSSTRARRTRRSPSCAAGSR